MLTMSTIITGVSSSMPQVTVLFLGLSVVLHILDTIIYVLCQQETDELSADFQVSYVKAVDIYLWTSFLFVFLSVIEYAAVNYCTTLEEMRKMKRGKVSRDYSCSRMCFTKEQEYIR